MTAPDTNTNFIDFARRLAELGQAEKALQAYALVLKQANSAAGDRMEAACALLQYGEDYTVAYDAFLALHKDNSCREDAFSILTDAFYLPNEEQMKQQYAANCALLAEYPYLFRKDLLPFEELSIRFYPYDDNGVIPYHVHEDRFGTYTDVNEQVIGHHFFRDLTKPVLAENIFSQYELEYLVDNVRRSDWVARENHIYLHYTDWSVFCAYLQVLDIAPLLEEEKIVFLIGDEISQYPIDFKARFGIDYSQFSVKPFGIREINKVIWHTQLNAHNGGDFFNEILHGHPNIIADRSIMFQRTLGIFTQLYERACSIAASNGEKEWSEETLQLLDQTVMEELLSLPGLSLKDAMAAYYLAQPGYVKFLDPASRIVPAILYQPHFHLVTADWVPMQGNCLAVKCRQYNEIKDSGLLQQFKYIKTFTPMRRPTTSYAASVRFSQEILKDSNEKIREAISNQNRNGPMFSTVPDFLYKHIMNRSLMVDHRDRLQKDSRLVRFEDGKLNPTATFTALAEFLDIPYTESMTYCSNAAGKDPLYEGVAIGMSTAPVYRTYDEYADQYERQILECLQRDIYRAYGYSFHYYDGEPMDQQKMESVLEQCHTSYDLIRAAWDTACRQMLERPGILVEKTRQLFSERAEDCISGFKKARLILVRVLGRDPIFCAEDGTPLRMIEPLKLDPALLEHPLYE